MKTTCVAFAFTALFLCGAAGCGSGDDTAAAAPQEAGSDAKASEGGSGEGEAPKTEAGSEAGASEGGEGGSEAAASESGAD